MFATGDFYLSRVHLALDSDAVDNQKGQAIAHDYQTEMIPVNDFASELNIYLLVVRSTCHAVEAKQLDLSEFN